MTFKATIIGLLASFGFPWLVAVVIPFASMRTLQPVKFEEGDGATGVYSLARDGRTGEGSKVYGQEGCYQCHTQLIRPTYAGQDVHRDEWAGLRKSLENPDTRRETLPTDFAGEDVALIGVSRVGPDLSNLGRRLEKHLAGSELSPEMWIYLHLYNPRNSPSYIEDSQEIRTHSACPAKSGLFNEVSNSQAGAEALPVAAPKGRAIVPTDRARALASYLAALKKDTLGVPLPKSLNYNPTAPAAE